MDLPAIVGVTTGSLGLGISLVVFINNLLTSKSKVLPYITKWLTLTDENHIEIAIRLAIQNRSTMPDSICRVLLRERNDESLTFEPEDAAYSLDNKKTVDTIYIPNENSLILPANIDSKHSISGWLRFNIDRKYINNIKSTQWYVQVWDINNKNFKTDKKRDQKID